MRIMTDPSVPNTYRVVLERLRPRTTAVYQTEVYGPYASLGAARSQETKIMSAERAHGRQARSFIEVSPLSWSVETS